MGIGRTAAARPEPPREMPTCDACHTTGQPVEGIGDGVVICVAYAPCIARAKATGTWCR